MRYLDFLEIIASFILFQPLLGQSIQYFYINNSVSANGNGTQNDPFNTLDTAINYCLNQTQFSNYKILLASSNKAYNLGSSYTSAKLINLTFE